MKEEQMKTNTVPNLMRQARGVRSAKHFQLLFGKFQKAIAGLSIELQDSACREFRRVAKAGFERNGK